MPRSSLLLLALLAACTRAERVSSRSFPAGEVDHVFLTNDRGDFLYSGTSPDTFEVGVHVFARSFTRGTAEGRLDRVSWGAAVDGDTLDLWGRTRADGAGVDFIVEGPLVQDIEAILVDGDAEILDVTGDHIVTANTIVGRGLVGDVDFLALSGGIDLSARPEPGDTLAVHAAGDTFLTLPYGLEYDLEVFPDPDLGSEVTDLGFDRLDASPDYVRAVSGSGNVRIDVSVSGGRFFLWNAAN